MLSARLQAEKLEKEREKRKEIVDKKARRKSVSSQSDQSSSEVLL